MDSLSEDNLIGADASLLGFVRSADQQGCRLIVSGPEISGLVTRSDLQRLPVRASLFALVTHLEMTMSDSIRREFPNGDGWLDRLSECRRANVIREESKSKSADSFVDTLLFTQFADKRDIIRRSSLFSGSKSSYDRDMKQIRSLRDHLAHANDYARTRVMQIDVSKTVRLTESWIERLANFPAN